MTSKKPSAEQNIKNKIMKKIKKLEELEKIPLDDLTDENKKDIDKLIKKISELQKKLPKRKKLKRLPLEEIPEDEPKLPEIKISEEEIMNYNPSDKDVLGINYIIKSMYDSLKVEKVKAEQEIYNMQKHLEEINKMFNNHEYLVRHLLIAEKHRQIVVKPVEKKEKKKDK